MELRRRTYLDTPAVTGGHTAGAALEGQEEDAEPFPQRPVFGLIRRKRAMSVSRILRVLN
jgi:hypothetical protein